MRDSAGPLARLVPAISLGLLAQAAGFPAAILTTLLLTRHVGADAFADLGIAIAILSPIGWTIGATYKRLALARAIGATDPRAETWSVAQRAALGGAIAWAVIALTAWPLSLLTGRDSLTLLLLVGGAEFVLLPATLALRSGLTAMRRFAGPGLATALFFIARLALALAVVLLGGGIAWALGAFVAARGLELIWCARRLAAPGRAPAANPAPPPPPKTRHLAILAICSQVVLRVDILLLALFGAAATRIGEYAAAQQIANTPGMAAGVIAPMLAVILSTEDKAHNVLGHRVDIVAALGVFACVASAGPAWLFATSLFGPDYPQAGPLLALLMAGGAGTWLIGLASGRWVALGQAARPLVVTAPMAGAALILHPPAILVYGASGAAMVTCGVCFVGGTALYAMLPGARRSRCTWIGAAAGSGFLVALAVLTA